jgi:phosphatidate cytidylyltransferase
MLQVNEMLEFSVLQAMMFFYFVLGCCSLLVAVKTKNNQDNQLRKQVFAWWTIFPVVSLNLFLYPLGPFLLVLLIALLAMRELSQHLLANKGKFFVVCSLVLGFVIGYADRTAFHSYLSTGFFCSLLWMFFRGRNDVNQLLYSLFFFSCCGIGFILLLAHISDAGSTNVGWLFYLFVLTALNDIAQFVAGKCFGTKKIASKISPNKTWQGLAGGVLCSILFSLSLGHYLRLATSDLLLLLAIILSLGGFVGDMVFSAAKRMLDIKDFSQLIPGHGGILDRVDSLVLTAPLLYFSIHFFHITRNV